MLRFSEIAAISKPDALARGSEKAFEHWRIVLRNSYSIDQMRNEQLRWGGDRYSYVVLNNLIEYKYKEIQNQLSSITPQVVEG